MSREFWTDERIAELKRLHAEGYSASHIRKLMGAATRNVVMGKLWRLGLLGKGPVVSRNDHKSRSFARPQRAAPAAEVALVDKPAPIEPATLPDGSRVTLLTLANTHCKWPIGHVGADDFHFCGQKRGAGPYCEHHASIAYTKNRVSRQEYELRQLLTRRAMAAR